MFIINILSLKRGWYFVIVITGLRRCELFRWYCDKEDGSWHNVGPLASVMLLLIRILWEIEKTNQIGMELRQMKLTVCSQ